MTLQEFDSNLKQAFPDVYSPAAPKGKARYVVWNPYGSSSLHGDDRNQLDCPKVQIDIVTQLRDDSMADAILGALWLMDLPYDVAGTGYDPEYNAYRTTLTLVVI